MTNEAAGAATNDSCETALRRAQAAFAAGRETEGLELLRVLMAREPMNAHLWHRASTLLQVQRPADAAATAAVAVCLAPDCLEYRLTLAEALFRGGDLARAISEYEIAVQIAPGDVRVVLGLASALKVVGLHEEAAAVCHTALQANPADASARDAMEATLSRSEPERSAEIHSVARRLFEEASRLESTGHPAQALEVFRRCAQLLPAVAPTHYRIGRLLQDAGQAEHARSHYELAARQQPGLFAAAHNAGKLAAGFGLVDRARRYLSQAHRLRPQDGISMRLELLTEAIHPSTEAISGGACALRTGTRPRARDDHRAWRIRSTRPICPRSISLIMACAIAICTSSSRAPSPCRRLISTGRRLTAVASRRRPGRIRVGFISHFMRSHSIGKVARGLIAELSREGVRGLRAQHSAGGAGRHRTLDPGPLRSLVDAGGYAACRA